MGSIAQLLCLIGNNDDFIAHSPDANVADVRRIRDELRVPTKKTFLIVNIAAIRKSLHNTLRSVLAT